MQNSDDLIVKMGTYVILSILKIKEKLWEELKLLFERSLVSANLVS